MVKKYDYDYHPRHNPALASLIIRVSLAAVFAYAAIAGLLRPAEWLGFVPSFTAEIIDPELFLIIISISQLFLAVWLVTGKYLQLAAVAAIAFLLGIVITSPDSFYITFRDIGLAGAAVALMFLKK